jgi:hypothetical protein
MLLRFRTELVLQYQYVAIPFLYHITLNVFTKRADKIIDTSQLTQTQVTQLTETN